MGENVDSFPLQPEAGPVESALMALLPVIDDEPAVRGFPAELLRQSGHSAVSADNGREALRILQQSRVQLVLTDFCMPDQDGIELAQRVRLRFSEIQLITTSIGLGGESHLEAVERLGADAALGKSCRRPTSSNLCRTSCNQSLHPQRDTPPPHVTACGTIPGAAHSRRRSERQEPRQRGRGAAAAYRIDGGVSRKPSARTQGGKRQSVGTWMLITSLVTVT